MRKLNLLLMLTFIFMHLPEAQASSILVSGVHGRAFAIKNGQIQQLKMGDQLDDFYELMTEEGAQLTLIDYNDHKYYLSGEGHIKILNDVIELKRGYLWIQSFSLGRVGKVHTANALMSFDKGEFIISFDNVSGKSQVLALDGKLVLANMLEKNLKVTVDSGQFSFIDKEYEDGIPREPTQVGYSSYQKVVSLFADVKPIHQNEVLFAHQGQGIATVAAPSAPVKKHSEKVARAIASLNQEFTKGASQPPSRSQKVDLTVKGKGKILLLKEKASRAPSSFDLQKMYDEELKSIKKKKAQKKWTPGDVPSRSKVPFEVHGLPSQTKVKHQEKHDSKVAKKMAEGRSPSSVKSASMVSKKESAFEGSLMKQYKNQMRHSNEVNALIDQLKSFDQDYQKEF